MLWFRKAVVGALLLGSGATVSAQVIRLGQPTPLGAGQPRPSVVRAAQPEADEPKTLPALPAPQLEGSATLPAQAIQPLPKDAPLPKEKADDGAKIIEVDQDGKVTVVPDAPRFAPLKAKAPPVTVNQPAPPVVSEPTVLDERVIMVDDAGNPLWTGGLGAPARFYVHGEYLHWWTRGMYLPPLVVTDLASTPQATQGILGNGTARLIFGDSTTSQGPTPGARLTLGYSLDPCNWCVLEGSFFFLNSINENTTFTTRNFPVIARPAFDLNNGVLFRELTASPGTGAGDAFSATGSIRIETSSSLFGAEANIRSLLWRECNFQVTGLIGFRYLDLSDNLRIEEATLNAKAFALPPPDASIRVGDLVATVDVFDTRNRFYGGQLGAAVERQFGRLSVEARFKLGLGVTQQTVDVDGFQRVVSRDGRIQSFVGGLYAVPSNMGTRSQSQFGFVPEVGVKLNYQLTDHVSVFVGYDFMFWSSVLRPGDQIDEVLDLNQVPNSGRPYRTANQVRPVIPFQTTSYWAQGANAGLLLRY